MSDTPMIYAADTAEDDEPTGRISLNGFEVDENGEPVDDFDATDGGGDGLSLAEIVTYAPNGAAQTAELDADDAVEITVTVEDGQTLDVFRWGAEVIPTGDVPTGLECRLLDDGDTVQESEETRLTYDRAEPIASLENTSGGLETYKLQAFNATGETLGDTDGEGVGFEAGYVVS